MRPSIVVVALSLAGCGTLVSSSTEPLPSAAPVEDRDGDGLAGDADQCADAAEDFDGFRDDDGCPDLDDDEDGIPDTEDRCRCVAEDRDGFVDDDGCPDLDNDDDGILDACDACPNDAEVHDGCADEDGCPDRAHLRIERARIVVVEHVPFERRSSTLGENAQPVLATIAAALRDNPHITRVRIVGHADQGEPRPDRLSRARATAVRDWLVEHGIDAARLEVEGAADARPLVSLHGPPSTRVANQRVELEILEDGVEDPPHSLGGHAPCRSDWRSPCFDHPPPEPRDVCAE